MKHQDRVGVYEKRSVVGESYGTYVPKLLPPQPPIEMEKVYDLLEKANVAIGRLDGLSATLPDTPLFLYMYVRKEAILSSQIEGTQSTLSDLLLYENNEATEINDIDIKDVSNYVAAMYHGLERIKGGFPLSLRLIKEMHQLLLSDGRGSSKQPGEFRHSQNWIGGTRPGNAKFVPPSPEKIMELLGNLELFLHDDNVKLPTLIKAGLAHVQFETIHPFLDGNGRLGRLLITFILCANNLLQEPLLYLSLYFNTHRQLYFDHLQLVRETGDWEEWLQFFLTGVIETADQAVATARAIVSLFKEDREKIEHFNESVPSTLMVHHYLQNRPITSAKKIAQDCKISLPTINKVLKNLIAMQLVKETSGKERKKIYVYEKYMKILSDGEA